MTATTKMTPTDRATIMAKNREALAWKSGNDIAWMRDYSRMTVNAATGMAEYWWTTCDENDELIDFNLTVNLSDEEGNCNLDTAYRAIYKSFMDRGAEYAEIAAKAAKANDFDKLWCYKHKAEDMTVFAQTFSDAAMFDLGVDLLRDAACDGLVAKIDELGDEIDRMTYEMDAMYEADAALA